jgi:hypothetical protein
VDHALQHKAPCLNAVLHRRTVFAIVLFSFYAYYLSAKSRRQDETGDPSLKAKMHDVSAVGLLLYLIVNTFMGFDWLMSLDPHWFSSLYGAIFVAGEALAGMTFIILIANGCASVSRWTRSSAASSSTTTASSSSPTSCSGPT